MAFKKKEVKQVFTGPVNVIGLGRTEEGLVLVELCIDANGELVPDSLKLSQPNLKAIINERARIAMGRLIQNA